jgi:hypothetical protein
MHLLFTGYLGEQSTLPKQGSLSPGKDLLMDIIISPTDFNQPEDNLRNIISQAFPGCRFMHELAEESTKVTGRYPTLEHDAEPEDDQDQEILSSEPIEPQIQEATGDKNLVKIKIPKAKKPRPQASDNLHQDPRYGQQLELDPLQFESLSALISLYSPHPLSMKKKQSENIGKKTYALPPTFNMFRHHLAVPFSPGLRLPLILGGFRHHLSVSFGLKKQSESIGKKTCALPPTFDMFSSSSRGSVRPPVSGIPRVTGTDTIRVARPSSRFQAGRHSSSPRTYDLARLEGGNGQRSKRSPQKRNLD